MALDPAGADDDDLDELTDRESRDDRHRVHRRRDRSAARSPPKPVRRWRRSDEEAEASEDDDLDLGPPGGRKKPPVFWRARDSLYFEPLVALAIIAVLLVSLFAYTSNWPPVYVIESNSMQHGHGDHVGDLNAGDIVLAEKVGLGSIVSYVQGIQSGFSTYGYPGDVLLYYPNGTTSSTPIIHRAIIYLQYDAHNATYNATGLTRSECGNGTAGGVYTTSTPTKPSSCLTIGISQADKLVLYGIGGRTVAVNFAYTTDLGSHSGFLTLGDNNSRPDQAPGGGHLSGLVEAGWIIGVARGMIPWFGALKLLLDGNAGKVPTASWEFLGLTVAGVIFAAAGLHLLLRREREPRARRRERHAREDEEAREEGGEPPGRERRAPEPVRPWSATGGGADEPDAEQPARPKRLSYEQRRRLHFVSDREKKGPPRRPARRRTQDPDEGDDS